MDTSDKYRKQKEGDVVNVNDDIVFEMELIKQVEINIDYILHLIAQMHGDHTKDKEISENGEGGFYCALAVVQ